MALTDQKTSIIVYRWDGAAFNRITTITDYVEFSFERLLYGVGNFSITVNLDSRHASLLKKWDFIQLGTEKQRQGIIRRIEAEIVIERDQSIKQVTFEGVTINTILASSYCYPPVGSTLREFVNTPVETIMKTLLDESRVNNVVDTDVNIPFLAIDTDQGRGLAIDDNYRYSNMLQDFERIGGATGIGYYFYVDYDTDNIRFEIIEGADRSINNSEGNDNIKLSFKRGNVGAIRYIDDGFTYRNHAIVAGDGSGAGRTFEFVDEQLSTDLWAMSVFVNAREQTTTQGLIDAGLTQLSEKQRIESFEIESITNIDTQVDNDFFLGDTITGEVSEIDISKDFQIIGITENYTRSTGFNYDLVLGNRPDQIEDSILKNIDSSRKQIVE